MVLSISPLQRHHRVPSHCERLQRASEPPGATAGRRIVRELTIHFVELSKFPRHCMSRLVFMIVQFDGKIFSRPSETGVYLVF